MEMRDGKLPRFAQARKTSGTEAPISMFFWIRNTRLLRPGPKDCHAIIAPTPTAAPAPIPVKNPFQNFARAMTPPGSLLLVFN
jgi:hypothetical protein